MAYAIPAFAAFATSFLAYSGTHVPLEAALPAVLAVTTIPAGLLVATVRAGVPLARAALSSPLAFVQAEVVREAVGLSLVLVYLLLIAAPVAIEGPVSIATLLSPMAAKSSSSSTERASDAGVHKGGTKAFRPDLASTVYPHLEGGGGRMAITSLAFLAAYALLWAGWKTALGANLVQVAEHCRGLLS